MFLRNRNIISKIKRSKVTDYAALKGGFTSSLCMSDKHQNLTILSILVEIDKFVDLVQLTVKLAAWQYS